jgi:beta-mannosidase
VKLRGDEKLWTIYEFGEQYLHTLKVTCDSRSIEKRVGLRNLELVTNKDDYGTTFLFRINGHIINCKGSDLIPLDSLPSRVSYEKYYALLSDVKAAHMNVLRCWGGGHYSEDLYKAADALGILIWQDLMFACAQSPPVDWFFKEVQEELECQVRRNSYHACIMFWVGGNEVHQTIQKDGKHDAWLREKYGIFNKFLKANIERLDPSRRFWPDSPASGSYRYQDKQNWSSPYSGDMHIGTNWNVKRPFEGWYKMKPRFIAEFGFQSWPSLPVVKSFCPPDEFNLESPTMKVHQKNPTMNVLIPRMFRTYFMVPKNFEQQLYLSQVQQATLIKLGAEWWRTTRPITRGMMFWQLNDCWPVSSWSSIEHDGRWKILHYQAARFYAPLAAVFYEVSEKDGLQLKVVNDRLDDVDVKGEVKFMEYDGKTIDHWDIRHKAGSDTASEVWMLNLSQWSHDKRDSGFFYCQFTYDDKGEQKSFNNFFIPYEFKFRQAKIKTARISVSVKRGEVTEIGLKTDYPAFFVHLESEKVLHFSDSSFVLLPGDHKLVTCKESIGLDDLRIYQLADVSNHSKSAED